jgi:branched-chain amino acid transport system permease protein
VDNPLVRRAAMGAGIALLTFLLFVLIGQKQALVIGVITGAAYGLLGLGLVLIYKSSGVFNFAQGEFGTVAIYALYLLHSSGFPYVFALIGALAVAVVFGLVVERVIVRPLFDAPRVTLLVATAGVSLLAVGIEIWFGEARIRNVDPAFPRTDRVSLLGVRISDQRLLLIFVLIVLAGVLAYFFNRTNLGLAILGASQEPTATELVGISVKRLSSFTWALAALLGGLAGVIGVPAAGNTFGPGVVTSGLLIPAFTAAVLGGFTSLPGAFLGGAIVGVSQALATSADFFDFIPGQAGTVIAFVLLVSVLSVRPNGLLGKA